MNALWLMVFNCRAMAILLVRPLDKDDVSYKMEDAGRRLEMGRPSLHVRTQSKQAVNVPQGFRAMVLINVKTLMSAKKRLLATAQSVFARTHGAAMSVHAKAVFFT